LDPGVGAGSGEAGVEGDLVDPGGMVTVTSRAAAAATIGRTASQIARFTGKLLLFEASGLHRVDQPALTGDEDHHGWYGGLQGSSRPPVGLAGIRPVTGAGNRFHAIYEQRPERSRVARR
jgi:hypothetical protein